MPSTTDHYSRKLDKSKMDAVLSTLAVLKKRLIENNELLIEILSEYQTENVTKYELERCLRTLEGLEPNYQYIGLTENIESCAIMLPSNLPLYSLVVFALIPSFMITEVNLRPNTLLQENNIIEKISNALELEKLFKNVKIFNTNHKGFLPCINKANLVVFTGKPSNAEKFLKDMPERSVLILNGSGHNPLVITETANLEKAVEDAVHVKGFNGGQDCAGPDAILVHEGVAEEFIKKFSEKYLQLKTGVFTDPETIIGPINRLEELERLAEILFYNRKDILAGGVIDYKNNIVNPTIIVSDIKDEKLNYKEMYSPIAFIHVYHEDKDLSLYFEGNKGAYPPNRMYVSLYGDSAYVSSKDDSKTPGKSGNVGIVMKDKIIHDVEIGYNAYGGYGMHASSVIKKEGQVLTKYPMPILIPEVIAKFLLFEAKTELKKKDPNCLPHKKTFHAVNDFDQMVADVFKENLVFGFVFGSATRDQLKINGEHISDLDTFICMKDDDDNLKNEYLTKLKKIHEIYHLKVDEIFPAEIMSLATLEKSIENLKNINFSLNEVIRTDKYDSMFWACILTESKMGLLGNGKSHMIELAEKSKPYLEKWSAQILRELNKIDVLPSHIKTQFPGKNKEEVMCILEKLDKHEIIKKCLMFDNSSNTMNQKKPYGLSRNSLFKEPQSQENPNDYSHIKTPQLHCNNLNG
ncbi:MAG: aldehyde dehydrogenase [Legionella sp.]|nr:aldehyde dehydrogenase [Legionella sp.]